MIAIIAAIDQNGNYSADGKLPWEFDGVKLSSDLKRFKALTKGQVVVMGRKTWESLPKKPLPDRVNIVVSTTLEKSDGATIVESFEEACVLHKQIDPEKKLFVIGGSVLWDSALRVADEAHITEIRKIFGKNAQAVASLPWLKNLSGHTNLHEVSRLEHVDESTGITVEFVTYSNHEQKMLFRE